MRQLNVFIDLFKDIDGIKDPTKWNILNELKYQTQVINSVLKCKYMEI